MGDKILSKLGGRMRRIWGEWRLRRLLDPDKAGLTRLGTAHGGWTVPTSKLKSGVTAICVGAGEDISFDVELCKRGVTVVTMDPTPRAKEHITRVLQAASGGPRIAINQSPTSFYDLQGFDQGRFKFLDAGLWETNTSMRFFAPHDQHHVSHSIVNLQHTNQWFEARCITLRTACELLDIREIDILKLDIEGAEYAVLKNIVESGPLPGILCFEFDEMRNPLDGGYMKRIMDLVRMMIASGYKFRHIEESNALFVRSGSSEDEAFSQA